jgi:prophage antirepressor-like protein
MELCEILEINISQTRRLDDDEKGLRLVQTPGGSQEMLAVNESGLYSLVLGSRKAQAKRFKKWVTSEVLPSIRKTGKYELPQAEQPPVLQQETKLLPPASPEEICQLVDLIYGQIDERLKRQAKARAIAKQHPQHAVTVETMSHSQTTQQFLLAVLEANTDSRLMVR